MIITISLCCFLHMLLGKASFTAFDILSHNLANKIISWETDSDIDDGWPTSRSVGWLVHWTKSKKVIHGPKKLLFHHYELWWKQKTKILQRISNKWIVIQVNFFSVKIHMLLLVRLAFRTNQKTNRIHDIWEFHVQLYTNRKLFINFKCQFGEFCKTESAWHLRESICTHFSFTKLG